MFCRICQSPRMTQRLVEVRRGWGRLVKVADALSSSARLRVPALLLGPLGILCVPTAQSSAPSMVDGLWFTNDNQFKITPLHFNKKGTGLLERTLGFFRQMCTRSYETLEHCLPRRRQLAEALSKPRVHQAKKSVRVSKPAPYSLSLRYSEFYLPRISKLRFQNGVVYPFLPFFLDRQTVTRYNDANYEGTLVLFFPVAGLSPDIVLPGSLSSRNGQTR
jgi:hypothetical protein